MFTHRDLWQSSHDWSRAITYESAALLGVPGHEREVGPDAEVAREVAQDLLKQIERSRPTEQTLYSGHLMSEARRERFVVGARVRLPLTSLATDWRDALSYANAPENGAQRVVLRFPRGAKATKYSPEEWITAGDFVVRRVRFENADGGFMVVTLVPAEAQLVAAETSTAEEDLRLIQGGLQDPLKRINEGARVTLLIDGKRVEGRALRKRRPETSDAVSKSGRRPTTPWWPIEIPNEAYQRGSPHPYRIVEATKDNVVAVRRFGSKRPELHAVHEASPVADSPSLPFALVRQGADVVPVLLGEESGELIGIDIVNERVLNFGERDILGLVNAEPAAVWYGARVEMAGEMRMAAEDKPHPSPETRHAKKGDVIIQYPGFKAIKGKPFQVRPRGQRFQWTPEKPQGMTAFPEVKVVLMKQREQIPSLASIQVAAMFAGLTVHAGTDEAEETFGMLLDRYRAMHGSWPPIQEVMDILRRHNPTLRGNLYETVPPWSVIVQDALKRGLRDRELRRHIWIELSGEDQVASLGLAKMSLAFMLLGQSICCLDTWILGGMFAVDPFNTERPADAAERRREAGYRISGLWKWAPAKKSREMGLKRYEQVENALLKNNPWCRPGPIMRAQCQWQSWEFALGVPAYHRPWLDITKELQAKSVDLQAAVPF